MMILIKNCHRMTIQWLSKYQKVMFEYDFNQPVDNLPNSITHIQFAPYS